MFRIDERCILQIIKKDNETTTTKIGTCFLINKYAHFITARHVFPSLAQDILNDYRIVLNNIEYKFQRITPNINYDKNSIDIILFKLTIQDDTHFIPLYSIPEERISGQAIIYGYRNSEDGLKSDILQISGFNKTTNAFELNNQNNTAILEGCSGSPIFLLENDKPKYLLGVMSHVRSKEKTTNNIYTINLLNNLGYPLPKLPVSEKYFENIEDSEVCKKISFFTKYNLFSPKINYEIIHQLHQGLEHAIILLEQDFKKNGSMYDVSDKRIRLTNILNECKKVFNVISIDVAIHIKLIEDTNTNGTFLASMCRVPSKREESMDIERSNLETYSLSDEVNIDVLEEEFKRENIRSNLAYNWAYKSYKKFWICNDLKEAKKIKKFYSSSNNYEKFYTSLAVFGLYNKNFDDTQEINISDIKGFLIIDCWKKGAFEFKYTKQLSGYMAHRINRLLDEYYQDFFEQCAVNRFINDI